MQVNTSIKWDAEYDVVVLGFGGAGATAARFAADNGAKVLLVDSAPEGEEGGNTRYCGQAIGAGNDYQKLYNYYSSLTAPMHLDEEIKKTFVSGMFHMQEYVQKYLDVEPFSFDQSAHGKAMKDGIHEYPEYPGSDAYDMLAVHDGLFDAALWKILRQKVIDRRQNIDIWYETPAKHLVQNEYHKTVLGVQVDRKGTTLNVCAKNGVVMALGGFENNQKQIENYLGVSKIAPLGSLYNQGTGIDMAIEAGAQLWHMQNFESAGMLHGMYLQVDDGKRGVLELEDTERLHKGSIFVVGNDGTRYFDESEANRHGHLYNHGSWTVPQNQTNPYIIFDQKQYVEMKEETNRRLYESLLHKAVSANKISELATKIGVKPEVLDNEVEEFNFFAEKGKDYKYNREPKTLRAFEDGPFYAVALEQTLLNTQGGPIRNSQAEILDTKNEPIPHLYGAGELGGICANQYQGGGNIAECLIFGKIAGENAAKKKQYFEVGLADDIKSSEKAQAISEKKSDLLQTDSENTESFATKGNQFIGKSTDGIGDELIVRVTLNENQSLQKVEILKQSETDLGAEAIEKMPLEMVAQNTYDVDTVSGASSTSTAIKSAVKNALEQAKQNA